MAFKWLVWIIIAVFVGFVCIFILLYQKISQFDQVTQIKGRELVLICLTLFFSGLVSSFVVHKQQILVYLTYTYLRLVYSILSSVVGAGLFAGFMTTAKLGYIYYLFVVPRLVFDNYEDSFGFEHHQKRVAAISSFVIGQLVMFTSVYHRTLHQRLVQPDSIFLLFTVFFITQVVWVRLTIVRNWKYLYPRDKRKKVVRRIVLLQGEFVCNFFLQLALLPSNSYIGGTSKIRTLVNTYLKNPLARDQTKKLFVQTAFFGWLVSHIFFMILYVKAFQFIVIITIWVNRLKNWLITHYKDQKKDQK